MSEAAEASSNRSALDPEWQRAFAWVEKELGGRITSWERQTRWRPAWFLKVERDGETLPVFFRGDRGEADHGVYPLEHEMKVLQVLEAHDIPVPHVYGFCPEPRGIVMEQVPGRANLATADSDAERESVLDHYMELLAQMHAIDVSAFEAVGLDRPTTAEQLALGDFDAWEKSFRKRKARPEPLIEFGIRWVRSHVPAGRDRASFLTCDAGQFLFDAGRVTAVLDLELAYLGDPAADIAGMLLRDLSEPLGDINRGLEAYERCGGQPVDPDVVHYHAVRFGMCTPMVVSHLVAKPVAEIDPVQYLAWYLVYARIPVELMADLSGVELGDVAHPDVPPSRQAAAHATLVSMLEPSDRDDEFQTYERATAHRLAAYLERAERYGPALEADDLDELAPILGHRPASWAQADAELEDFVRAAGPERDAELIRWFYRHLLRQEAIAKPVLLELEHAAVQKIQKNPR